MISTNGQAKPKRLDRFFEPGSIIVANLLFSAVGRKHAARVNPATIPDPLLARLAREAIRDIGEKGEASWQLIGERLQRAGFDCAEITGKVNDLLEWSSFDSEAIFDQALDLLAESYRDGRMLEACHDIAEAGNLSASGIMEHLREIEVDQGEPYGAPLGTLADTLALPDEETQIIHTGIRNFDEKMPGGGLQAGDKVVVAAPPGLGKTALCLQLTLAALTENPELHAVFANGETAERQLRNRALMNLSGLPIAVHAEPIHREKIEEARATLADIGRRFHLVQAPLTPARIESAVVTTGAKWLVVDYLQLCRLEKRPGSRREEIDQILGELARIAQAHGVVVLIISNQAKGDQSGRDIFTACKESSEIAYTADLLYVGELDGDYPSDDQPDQSDIRWRCLKCRNGSPRSLITRFRRWSQTFDFRP